MTHTAVFLWQPVSVLVDGLLEGSPKLLVSRSRHAPCVYHGLSTPGFREAKLNAPSVWHPGVHPHSTLLGLLCPRRPLLKKSIQGRGSFKSFTQRFKLMAIS